MENVKDPRASVLAGADERWARSLEAPVQVRSFSPGRPLLVTLVRRELQMLKGGLRFRAAFLLIIGLMAASALINSVRYGTEVRIYDEVLTSYSEELKQATVSRLAEIHHPAMKPPWGLAFLVDGEQTRVPNVYRLGLSPWTEPELGSQHGVNYRLPVAEPLDWLFLVRVVLSLAAFILGYDAICGDRQRGAARMVLSYPVARWQVLLAKLSAIWICLAAPFLIGGCVSLVLLRFYGDIHLNLSELTKIALVALLALWAIALFVLMALVISALNRDAARSLAVLALIWVTAVAVTPSSSGLAARVIHPVPVGLERDQRLDEIRRLVEREHGGAAAWRPKELARDEGYDLEKESARMENRRRTLQQDYRRKLVRDQFEQLALARKLSSISPMLLIQDLAERLAGSGPYRDRRFLEQAWDFQGVLAAHVAALDQADPDSPNIFFIEKYMSNADADADAVPRFEFREATVRQGLGRSERRFLLLGLVTVVLAAVALGLFARYDLG